MIILNLDENGIKLSAISAVSYRRGEKRYSLTASNDDILLTREEKKEGTT